MHHRSKVLRASGRTFQKIVATKYSTSFREATTIIDVPYPMELKPSEVLVKNVYTGINASDINFTAGIYQPDVRPPFDCGFEAIGEVVDVGSGVKDLHAGNIVVTQSYGSFAEYQVVPRRHAKVAPSLDKVWLPLDLSGTTASIALREVLKPMRGERAVVTAACGGTGQYAVQLLRAVYGCSVVGVCSTAAKEDFLVNSLKCEGVVNYRTTPDVRAAFRSVYPRGVNCAYESVGGDLLEAVVDSMALRGRVLSIGGISSYAKGSVVGASAKIKPLPLSLLSHSATLHTFFLPHYVKQAPTHFLELCAFLEAGKITSVVDRTPFKGLAQVADAVDHMYAQKNIGKVLVEL